MEEITTKVDVYPMVYMAIQDILETEETKRLMKEITAVMVEEVKEKENLLEKKYYNILYRKYRRKSWRARNRLIGTIEIEDEIDKMRKKMVTTADKMDKDVDNMISKIETITLPLVMGQNVSH